LDSFFTSVSRPSGYVVVQIVKAFPLEPQISVL